MGGVRVKILPKMGASDLGALVRSSYVRSLDQQPNTGLGCKASY